MLWEQEVTSSVTRNFVISSMQSANCNS